MAIAALHIRICVSSVVLIVRERRGGRPIRTVERRSKVVGFLMIYNCNKKKSNADNSVAYNYAMKQVSKINFVTWAAYGRKLSILFYLFERYFFLVRHNKLNTQRVTLQPENLK